MEYTRVENAYKKLKRAYEGMLPVVVMGATGIGKTSAVENFYQRRSHLVLKCRDGYITNMPETSEITQKTVIIDDAQWLADEKCIKFAIDILEKPDIQLVVITRGMFPKRFAVYELDYDFVRIVEKDFMFGPGEVKAFFKHRDIEIDDEDCIKVAEASRGYPWAVFYYAKRMEDGRKFDQHMGEDIWHDLFRLWDGSIYTQLDPDFVDFAMSMCRYEWFTVEMAEFITGSSRVGEIIETCRNTTSQLKYVSEGRYRFRDEQRAFYIWKQNQIWDKEKINDNLCKGGYYFEINDDIPVALEYYKQAGAIRNIRELLIKNSRQHPGIGHYIETKDYYFMLDESDIKDSPVLMTGMSMLNSLIVDPDESERWYNELALYEKDHTNPKDMRKEARIRLAYLDIALAHRGTKGIIRIMRNVFSMMKNDGIKIPEMSATGNCPSLMNGGLDFSEWAKNDTYIARFMGKPLEALLGKYASGLITLGLAESGFERGRMEPYEVMTRCNNGYDEALCDGRIEMCFVAVGIQIRQHIVEGQIPSAWRMFNSFMNKIEKEGVDRLIPNLNAFRAWISLYDTGEYVAGYLAGAPDERQFFNILDRYRYMIKLRCLIYENRLDEAFQLSEYLSGYVERYERHFYQIENELLKGIILYRMNSVHWKEHITYAVNKASNYHFVRVISLEGNAILPLLRELENEEAFSDIPEEYYEQVIREAERIALEYPDYLKFIPKEEIKLTRRETQILGMLCRGMSTEDICKECSITYAALKKHNRNIYSKLGAKDRAEAERKAVHLGLVNR